jgi:hypothetical protein
MDDDLTPDDDDAAFRSTITDLDMRFRVDAPLLTRPLSGRMLARAWGNVALAAADDGDAWPALYRAVSVEVFGDRGIRLTSFDGGWLILTAFVPVNLDVIPPDIDEAPTRRFVARDTENRAKGLMKWIAAGTRKQDATDILVGLTIGTPEDLSGQQSLSGLSNEALMIETGTERVAIPLWDGDWPDWRRILAGRSERALDRIVVSPNQMKRLGSLSYTNACDLTFTSDTLVNLRAPGDTIESPDITGAFVRVPTDRTDTPDE